MKKQTSNFRFHEGPNYFHVEQKVIVAAEQVEYEQVTIS